MYAIIDIGGKQYKVRVGDTLYIEKFKAQKNSKCTFDRVVAIIDEKKAEFGAPFLKGASVDADVVKNGKAKKLRVFKYKPKKNYSRRIGHRSHYTKITILKINSAA